MTTPQEQWRKDNGKDYSISDPADSAFVGEGELVTVGDFLSVFVTLKLTMTREQLVEFVRMKREAELARQARRGRRA